MEENSKDRQMYQLHKKGYEEIAKAASKGISINVNGAKVKEVKMEGPKGEPGEPGKTPEKGIDYFTQDEVNEIVDHIISQIPVPKDGKDGKDAAPVDYGKVLEYVKREVSKIQIPKGQDGKDAVVDYDFIIKTIQKQIKVPKDAKEVDYDQIKKFIENAIEKTRGSYRGLNSGGPTTRLGEIVDVNVESAVVGSVLKYDGSNWVAGVDTGTVDSVNGQTGTVVLDADDIDDTLTNQKFVTATDITKLGNLSGTNTGDQTTIVGITGTIAQFNTAVTDANLATIAGTETLTNKRITKRVVTTTDDSTAVIDVDVTDVYQLSAVANATTFTLTGTPTDGQSLIVRFKDAGVAKGLTWTGFTAIGVTLPTTTVAGKWHYVGCQYNLAATAWHAIAVGVEA